MPLKKTVQRISKQRRQALLEDSIYKIERVVTDECARQFAQRFDVVIHHHPHLSMMAMVATRQDGIEFTNDQVAWLRGFDAGILTAKEALRNV